MGTILSCSKIPDTVPKSVSEIKNIAS